MPSKVTPKRVPYDGTGYTGPLRWVEHSQGSKYNRDFWRPYDELTVIVYDAAFQGYPWTDSHAQIAHYPRALPWALRDRRDEQPEDPLRLEKLDDIPQLANLIIDLDHDDVTEAQRQAVRLVEFYTNECRVPEEAVHIAFSTRKGFHISLPWQVIGVPPTGVPALNWAVYKRMAGVIAERLGLTAMDEIVYKKNGFIRLENTLHPKTKLFKVRVTPEELAGSIEQLREIAQAPRRAIYDVDLGELYAVSELLHGIYRPAQLRADAEARKRHEEVSRPADPDVLAAIGDGVTPCLTNIRERVDPGVSGNRNNTLMHAVMMLKHLEKTREEITEWAKDWLGPRFHDPEVGAAATIESVWSGPYRRGCNWMRENGFASRGDCGACPVNARFRPRPPERLPEPPPAPHPRAHIAPIEQKRRELPGALRDLDPHAVTIAKTPAGFGKTHATIHAAKEIVEAGGRVVVMVKDTKKENGLAAELRADLARIGYTGKLQTLYGRSPVTLGGQEFTPCDNWDVAKKHIQKGYPVGVTLCPSCFARTSCHYYGQYEEAYDAGIYIAPHAMLPYLFKDRTRGFHHKQQMHPSDNGVPLPLGAPLELIVIDEDALDSLLDEFAVDAKHLRRERKEKTRIRLEYDPLTRKRDFRREVQLDANWLRVVQWTEWALKESGPLIRTLEHLAKQENTSIKTVLRSIDPARVIDPDHELNRGHKPFTRRLYEALMDDLHRLEDGNPTLIPIPKDDRVIQYGVRELYLPPDVPVLVLDAYARLERYQAYFQRARVGRPIRTLEYEVREEPNVTYVLGATLTAGDVKGALRGDTEKLQKLQKRVTAVKELCRDEHPTRVVMMKSAAESDLLQRLFADTPHIRVGELYNWRGRGFNAALGDRIVILQDPNPPPEAVMNEASALYPDEPRLDDATEFPRVDVPWAAGATPTGAWRAARYEYADERLNLILRAKREDELVQMALRGRSITTGAEIIVMSDLVDERLPATRVLTLDALVAGQSQADPHRALFEWLRDEHPAALDTATLATLGVVQGGENQKRSPTAAALHRAAIRQVGGFYFAARKSPLPPAKAEELIQQLQQDRFTRGDTRCPTSPPPSASPS